jgi:hypothetical protein
MKECSYCTGSRSTLPVRYMGGVRPPHGNGMPAHG